MPDITVHTCGRRYDANPAGYVPGATECPDPGAHRNYVRYPSQSGVVRDTDGTILRGPSLPCGCPLDSGCDGFHG
jgi:hypothetical protein